MSKKLLSFFLLAILSVSTLALTGCNNPETTTPSENMEEAAGNMGEAMEEAKENVGEAMEETGEAVEETAEHASDAMHGDHH